MTAPTRSTTTTRPTADLEPVRRALLDDARHEADETVAAAQLAADQLVAAARRETEAELDEVRRRAEASAAARSDRAMAVARRTAHARELAVHDELRRLLVEQVRAAADTMRHDPRYPVLLDHLERLACEQLGSDAVIERDPAPGGGIVAGAGGRRVDYRLDALADRAVAAIADEVVTLWS